MYSAIWRILPGPVWLRILISIVLVVAVLAALMTWVFPVIDQWITNEEVTINE